MGQCKFYLDETTPLYRDETGAELHIDVNGVVTIEYEPADMNGLFDWSVEAIEIDRHATAADGKLAKTAPYVVSRDEPLWFTINISLNRFFGSDIQEAIRAEEDKADSFFDEVDAAYEDARAAREAAE